MKRKTSKFGKLLDCCDRFWNFLFKKQSFSIRKIQGNNFEISKAICFWFSSLWIKLKFQDFATKFWRTFRPMRGMWSMGFLLDNTMMLWFFVYDTHYYMVLGIIKSVSYRSLYTVPSVIVVVIIVIVVKKWLSERLFLLINVSC